MSVFLPGGHYFFGEAAVEFAGTFDVHVEHVPEGSYEGKFAGAFFLFGQPSFPWLPCSTLVRVDSEGLGIFLLERRRKGSEDFRLGDVLSEFAEGGLGIRDGWVPSGDFDEVG